LQKAIKHSGVRAFRVELSSSSSEVRLCIHDSGVGFNVAEALRGTGLGLITMKEWLHLLGRD